MGSRTAVAMALKMLIQALLGRLVIVRRHGKNSVYAHVFQFFRELDHFGGVVAARAREHRHLPLGFFERDLDHAKVLEAGQRGAFAGGAAGHQKVDAGLDLPAHQYTQSVFIERKILAGKELLARCHIL